MLSSFFYMEGGVSFFLSHQITWSSEPFLEKTVLSPLNGFGILIQSQLAIDVCVYFWTLGSVLLSVCQYRTGLSTVAL